jgi:predicted amidophosphoribosyltransferase
LGATRKQRFKQLEHAFAAQNLNIVRDAHILLIDDVLTTGATVEAAAGVLKAAGAKTIDVAVFAQP